MYCSLLNYYLLLFEYFRPSGFGLYAMLILLFFAIIISILFLVCHIRDLKKQSEYLRMHHELTGLPNKHSLYKDAQKHGTVEGLALLYIDIDHFKYVNNAAGQDFGDQVIRKVSSRLEELCQPKGALYHLGEDEFVIAFPNASTKGLGEIMAAHILAGFKNVIEIADKSLSISLSIGVVEQPEKECQIQQMLSAAEIAMYRAKASGRNRYIVYDKAMGQDLMEKMSIMKNLRSALENDEFEIYYQPQLDLAFDRIDGFEALLRWNSPKLGFVPPDKFIKAAEEMQLIVPLGTWVLRNTCAFLKRLESMGYAPLGISVNISVLQLLQDDFVPLVQETLEFLELDPEHLELEITESILMESFDQVKPKLEALRRLGVRIALDDFGKGYSSLSYLSQIPLTTLKLDKSFIDRIGTEHEGLIESIIYLCRKMNLNVVAEGIETHSQLNYLRDLGCHKMQGYLFSKPLPQKEIIDLMRSSTTLVNDIISAAKQEKVMIRQK
jgi:diguanylate cyclase (GGDEF)-like protein